MNTLNKDLDPGTVHVMIDLETWGTGPTAAVSTVGARMAPVVVDRQDLITRQVLRQTLDARFHQAITLESALLAGMETDADTVDWWRKQSAEARESLLNQRRLPLAVVLENLRQWLPPGHDYLIWGNGAAADPVWLESAYRLAGLACPWNHWQVRCYRTLRAQLKGVVQEEEFTGMRHHALADAVHQMRHLQAMLGFLRMGYLRAAVRSGAEGRGQETAVSCQEADDGQEGGPVS